MSKPKHKDSGDNWEDFIINNDDNSDLESPQKRTGAQLRSRMNVDVPDFESEAHSDEEYDQDVSKSVKALNS